MAHIRHNDARTVWPWDEQPARTAWFRRRGDGRAWLLPAATVAVLAGGYSWLGNVAAGMPGSVIGCLAGLAVTALLYLFADWAVSGRRACTALAGLTRRTPKSVRR